MIGLLLHHVYPQKQVIRVVGRNMCINAIRVQIENRVSNSHNNYHGILRLHQGKIREICFLEMLGTLFLYHPLPPGLYLKGAWSNFSQNGDFYWNCLIRFLRMTIFIEMMRHHPRNLDFKFQLSRLTRLDTRRDCVWYQDLRKFEKNLKESDRTPLMIVECFFIPLMLVISCHP